MSKMTEKRNYFSKLIVKIRHIYIYVNKLYTKAKI
jgi:hypothetical protein